MTGHCSHHPLPHHLPHHPYLTSLPLPQHPFISSPVASKGDNLNFTPSPLSPLLYFSSLSQEGNGKGRGGEDALVISWQYNEGKVTAPLPTYSCLLLSLLLLLLLLLLVVVDFRVCLCFLCLFIRVCVCVAVHMAAAASVVTPIT